MAKAVIDSGWSTLRLQLDYQGQQAARREEVSADPVERRKLVSRARNWLKPPFYLADGESVVNAEDLEIGPLENQLRRGRAPAELVRRAVDLRDLRNKLAHMETLTVEESLYRGLL